MKYRISISKDGTYLRIRVFDPITGEMENSFAHKAINKANQHNIKKFLVDVRGTPNIANPTEHYNFGYRDMNQFGLDRTSRIAVLADAHDKSHNFIETIFMNAGYMCRIFSDEDIALKWLSE